MVLLIDNYDSFSYNLYQLVGTLLKGREEIKVIRNDEYTVDEIMEMRPSRVIISPGPGRPADAGVIEDLVRQCNGKLPILGVCLGHQAICEALGGTVTYAMRIMHGKQSEMEILGECPIFDGLKGPVTVARYHSLAADEASLPDCLRATGRTSDGEIMAVMADNSLTYGLQFHPESIMTPMGSHIVERFLSL